MAMQKHLVVLLSLFLVALLSGCRPATSDEFAIYLTAEEMTGDQISKADLRAVRLQESPVIATADITSYSRDTHELELSEAAAQRLASLKIGVFGRGFVACVGAERIYAGAFWTPLSSASFDGVIIEYPPFSTAEVSVRLGYPAASYFAGPDPRADERIMRALEKAGRLR